MTQPSRQRADAGGPRRPLVLLAGGALLGALLAAAGLTAPSAADVAARASWRWSTASRSAPKTTCACARRWRAIVAPPWMTATSGTSSTASSRRSCWYSAASRSTCARLDRRVRADLTPTVIDGITSEASEREPTDDELARVLRIAPRPVRRAGPPARSPGLRARDRAERSGGAGARRSGGATAARRRVHRRGPGVARRSAAGAASRRAPAAGQAARLSRPDRAAHRARARRRRGERSGALGHRLSRAAGRRAPGRHGTRRSTRCARRWSASTIARPASRRCAVISTSCAAPPTCACASRCRDARAPAGPACGVASAPRRPPPHDRTVSYSTWEIAPPASASPRA